MEKQCAVCSRQLAEESGAQVSPSLLPTAHCTLPTSARGFTLIELVITLTVLTILTMSVIPLVKVSVKRQREQRLRDALREMRVAIDQFHREALLGAQMRGVAVQGGDGTGGAGGAGGAGAVPGTGVPPLIDPRIRVGITDNTIFGTENPDRYPPDLEILVSGVSVTPLPQPETGGGGIVGLSGSDRTATSNTLSSTKKKIYLREIPIDPMTGERDWEIRSNYDSKDASSWGGENVFDVRSKSTATALDGSKYSEW